MAFLMILCLAGIAYFWWSNTVANGKVTMRRDITYSLGSSQNQERALEYAIKTRIYTDEYGAKFELSSDDIADCNNTLKRVRADIAMYQNRLANI